MRPTLLRVLTDLYVQKLTHTPDEERHYTELALRLLDGVDVATRAAVAGRLARHLSPPLQVIERLARDLPGIAEAVSTHPLLQSSGNAGMPEVTAVAVTEIVAPADVAAPDEPDGETSQGEETVPAAHSPASIDAAVATELNELFFAADAHERRLILLNLEIVAPLPAGRTPFARDPAATERLEHAALTRNREHFAQYLAQALRIPLAQARRIAGDELGEPIVTAAKALNMPRDVVYRILLFINTAVGHSVERVHALATLYDEMPAQAAEHLVAIWQALHQAGRAAVPYRPLHGSDEARARARTATATVRRAPAAQRPSHRRDAS
jgi:uncharacterized protein (DUF2336 family)